MFSKYYIKIFFFKNYSLYMIIVADKKIMKAKRHKLKSPQILPSRGNMLKF